MPEREIDIHPQQLIVSKTDPRGHITYCNQEFVQLSGYTELELLGQPHSIVRHNDMPAGFFYLMWQELKQEKEFNGFIKNRTRNGDSYWAFTNITPMYDMADKLLGYTCTKRHPNPAATTLFAMHYEQMLEMEGGSRNEASAQTSAALLLELLSATGDNYEASVFKLQFS